MHRNILRLLIFTGLITCVHAGTSPLPQSRDEIRKLIASPVSSTSLVRVNATNQNTHMLRPWTKRPPYSRRGTGVVIDGGRILITAELIANSTFIDLETLDEKERSSARVVLVDYECNLAILEPEQKGFLEGAVPVQIAEGLTVGSKADIVQIEPTGVLARTPGTITTVTQSNYPVDGSALLIFRVSAPLQYRDNSFNLPLFSGAEFAGMLMRYDSRTQTADVVPPPVIKSFLQRAAKDPYQSFPRLGVMFAPNRDPKFRRFLGMDSAQSGVYVSDVVDDGPAAKAGIQAGDVILRMNGHSLDDDGNFEHPLFGKISFSHLISTERFPGDSLNVTVLRDGKELMIPVTLAPRDASQMISEPFVLDRAPGFFVLGGLVMQELSRAVLREWGSDWKQNAPQRLVYLDEFQDELPADRGKIIFISQVLPGNANLGYEDLQPVVVESINDREIRSLADVAEAVKHPIDGFHRIRIDSDPRLIILDAAEVAAEESLLQQTYGLPPNQ